MNLSRATLAIVFAAVLIVLPKQTLAEDAGKIAVAKVGNITITEQDVNREVQKIMPMQVSFHGGLKKEKLDEIKEEALQSLVDRAYKVQYAITEEISVDPEVVESEWQSFRSRYSKALEKMSSSQVASYKADMYLTLLADQAETLAVVKKIDVSNEDVKSFYETNHARYLRPKSFTASHVFVKVDPSDNKEEQEEKRKRAKALFERAIAGEDFYNLAYYESDDRSKYVGGSLGTFHTGQTVPEFEKAILAMKAGEIAGPVRTMYGFHVIKLDAVEEERQLSFEETSAKIRADLEEKQREKLYDQWMSGLKNNYPYERLSR